LHQRLFVQEAQQAAQPIRLFIYLPIVAEAAEREDDGACENTDDRNDDEQLEQRKAAAGA
jgi:hypothetical protein